MVDYSTNADTMVPARTVTAFFDTEAAASKAKADLVTAGVPASAVSMAGGGSGTNATPATAAGDSDSGFWHALKEFFMPDEDRYAYAEGLRRGGYVLSVQTDDSDYDRVLDILDSDGAVDIDEREKNWRSEGWSGFAPFGETEASYAGAGAETAGFGASMAGEDGYGAPATLTTTGGVEAESRADPSRVGMGAGTPGLLNPDMRERIQSGSASMTNPTPTGSQDATLHDNAAGFDRTTSDSAAMAEDAALGSPTRSGVEMPAARSTVGSMTSADADKMTPTNDRGSFRRDDALQRTRVRGYIRNPLDEDRTGTL